VHITYNKPKFDSIGEPISPKDSYWEAALYGNSHNPEPIMYGEGKTKAQAKANLQREINSRLEKKIGRYTQMLRFVTTHK
jgi:hypothetical protein